MKDRDRRTEFFQAAKDYTPFLATLSRSGATYLMRADDRNVGQSLFVKRGRLEMGVVDKAVAILAALVGESAVHGKEFLDVGANIGTSVIHALVTHGFGSGIAIEPEPENFRTLQLNACLNEVDDRLTCLQYAASDTPGSVNLVVEPELSGKHRVISEDRALVRDDLRLVEVPTVTLDLLAELGVFDPEAVGMLWIDAQGHEAHVLAGARRLTELGVPVVLELDPIALQREDHLRRLEESIKGNYTHFVDLRRNLDPSEPTNELRDVSALREFAGGFMDRSARGRRFTDVLAFNPSPDRVSQTDLSGISEKGADVAR